jgi:hypothetical protein
MYFLIIGNKKRQNCDNLGDNSWWNDFSVNIKESLQTLPEGDNPDYSARCAPSEQNNPG